MWPQNVCGGQLTADPTKPKLGGVAVSNLADLSSVFAFIQRAKKLKKLSHYDCM